MASPIKATIQDIRRLGDITGVLTKHGFDSVARRVMPGSRREPAGLLEAEGGAALLGERSGAARRFRQVLEDLGPTFVKLGQVLSTRPDLLPPDFIEELRRLQEHVQPIGIDQVEAQIEAALGRPMAELYASFDTEPLGSASIGQAHGATLADGRRVVVKVQRPGIEPKIRSDLDLLYTAAKLLEATIAEVEIYAPTGIVREFSRALLDELDFTREAENSEEFAKNFAADERVRAPAIVGELTAREVLTMEHAEGVPLSAIEGGSERAERVLDALLDAMVQQVVYDGFFHGDPHPGNIFVDDEDRLTFIDFGMVGRLSAANQDDIIDLIIAVVTGDVDAMARVLLKMGRPVGRVSMREFKADIAHIRDTYLVSNLAEIDVTRFIQEVMEAANRHQIRINSSYAVLVKAASTIEGIMRRLDPDLDLMARATPYVKELAARRFSARKLATGALRGTLAVSSFVSKVPEQLDQILMDLEGGNLSLRVRNDALDKIGQHANTLGTRLFLGMMCAAMSVCAAILLRGVSWTLLEVSVVSIAGGLCAAIAVGLFWWTLSWHVVGGRRSSKLRLAPLVRFLGRK